MNYGKLEPMLELIKRIFSLLMVMYHPAQLEKIVFRNPGY